MCVHDIWADDAAAARVRAAARGFETVPTVGIGSTILVNPRVSDVLAALAQHAPAIIVQKPPATGIWQRLRRARGVDPFVEASAPVGFACRVYRTEAGLEGAPSVTQLREVFAG